MRESKRMRNERERERECVREKVKERVNLTGNMAASLLFLRILYLLILTNRREKSKEIKRGKESEREQKNNWRG